MSASSLQNAKILLLLFVGLMASPADAQTKQRPPNSKKAAYQPKKIASNNFGYSGIDGWKVSGDARDFAIKGDHLVATDKGDGIYWYFEAPPKYLGNKKAAYGGLLLFDLNQLKNGDSTFHHRILVLSDGEHELVYTPSPARLAIGWVRFRVALAEGKNWSCKDRKVDRALMIDVLSNLKSMKINCEHTSNHEVGGLRNIALYAFNDDCGRFRKIMEDLEYRIQKEAGDKNRTITQMVQEKNRVVNDLDGKREAIVQAWEVGVSSLGEIKKQIKENEDMATNPYSPQLLKKAGTKLGTAAAAKAAIKKVVARRALLALGFVLDAIEWGNNVIEKKKRDKSFREILASGQLKKEELDVLHRVVCAELAAARMHQKILNEIKAEYDSAVVNYTDCRTRKSK